MSIRSEPTELQNVATAILAALIVLLTLGLLAWSGHYSSGHRVSPGSDTAALTRALLIGFAVSSLISLATKGFFTDVTGPSRMALGSFLILFWVLGLSARLVASTYQRRLFAQGLGVRKIMVLGTGREAEQVLDFIEARPWLGIIVAGRLCLEGACGEAEGVVDLPARSPEGGPPMIMLSTSLDGLRHLDQTMRDLGAEEVVVALEPEDRGKLPEITNFLSLVRVPYKIVPSLFEENMLASARDELTPADVLDMAVDTPDRLVLLTKRISDVMISMVAVIVLALLIPVVALAIVVESGRPVFYKQERLGLYGRRFYIHKFRTMVVNAEALLEELKDEDEGDGPHFKMQTDPRLTRVGAFLRKWSLDELPQFWNVLKGDMSVVGPRPPLPREVEQYEASHLGRLKGKPGITGLWQVSGRKNLSFEDMVSLDRYYLENWSLRLDISIILRTVSAVLTRRGAY